MAMRREWLICLLLAGITVAVYWPARHFAFLEYDDPAMVRENPQVRSGLTWASFAYACTTTVVGNWHPVTTLSHILDCQFFGLNAGPMHLVNVLFHSLNALLLFLVLRQLTGATWRSAIVAAFFALHPLRVESVAWISERKDLLSGFFFLLTIWAYAKYASVQSPKSKVQSPDSSSRTTHQPSSVAALRRVDAPRTTGHASRFYVLSLILFALGLMSKPMLVTLPFVLLLLDFWPLRRIEPSTLRSAATEDGSTIRPLLLEKLPFFILAAVFSAVTLITQARMGATALNARFTFEDRVTNALTSYARYLGKMFWPADLAIIYPHPGLRFPFSDRWPEWQVFATALLLLALTALCVCQLRRRPYLAFGWFWYVGMLVPVIGLIQAGEQSMADRYTYLPLIGPVISVVWLLAEFVAAREGTAAAETRERLGVRQSSGAVLTGPTNEKRQRTGALQNLADSQTVSGGPSADIRKWALSGLAVVLLIVGANLTRRQLNYWLDTVTLFEHAVEVTADNPGAQFCLGRGLETKGDLNRAIVHYRVAAAICPSCLEAHANIAHLLRIKGRSREAIQEYLAAISSKPDDVPSYLNLAGTLLNLGQNREAVQRFEEALQIDPDSIEALNNLAWLLAVNSDPAIRNGARAVEYATRACQLTQYKQTIMVGTLAAAYAEAARFKEAVATAEKACAMAERDGEQALLEKNRQLLELYRAGKPYREAAVQDQASPR